MGNEFYGEYLRWLRSHVADAYVPHSIEDIPRLFLSSSTVYECPTYVIDEAYFITWLSPKETESGNAAWFIFARADMRLLEDNGDVSSETVQTSYRCIAQK